MPVIQVKSRNVHVQELNKGAAETVLLIHGMFSNLSLYYFNIAPLLAKDFHVVMYDLKSHGLSEGGGNGYDLDNMADDLSALMEAIGLDKVHLGGYSFGGLIALNMALRFPEKLDKLLVIEAPDPADDKTRGIMDAYNREFLEHYLENFTDPARSRMSKRQLERNHRRYEYLFNQTTIKSDMLAERGFFGRAELYDIGKETLLIYGKGSNCMEAGKQLHAKIGRSQLITVNGDHNIPVQEPVIIGDLAVNFFKHKIFKPESLLWQDLYSLFRP